MICITHYAMRETMKKLCFPSMPTDIQGPIQQKKRKWLQNKITKSWKDNWPPWKEHLLTPLAPTLQPKTHSSRSNTCKEPQERRHMLYHSKSTCQQPPVLTRYDLYTKQPRKRTNIEVQNGEMTLIYKRNCIFNICIEFPKRVYMYRT